MPIATATAIPSMPPANLSPVALSYIAALRGIKPRRPGDAFTYGLIGGADPDLLIGLAASNPEGQFYGLITKDDVYKSATANATARKVANMHFIKTDLHNLADLLRANPSLLPPLDVLVCDPQEASSPSGDRTALFDLAAKFIKPNGLFVYGYQTNANPVDNLRFLVREFAPEMDAKQAFDFLLELKKLGTLFFKTQGDLVARLDQAIARNQPDMFFDLFKDGSASSESFNTIVALRPRGFTYAGDTTIATNYVELSIPPEAQPLIVECRDNPLYECIKDFTLNRTARIDIWCRQPAITSTEPAELFGGFAYGITRPRDQVPADMTAQGKTLRLDSPLYTAIIDLMTLMPVTIGDILSTEAAKIFPVADVVEAVQVLVACGVAQPMRGARILKSESVTSIAQPRLVGSFNQYLDKTNVTGDGMLFASAVLGDVIRLPARDALVMQALDRAGLANSADALFQELQKLAANPAEAARIMDVAEPTADTARTMIEDVVTESIVRWYAYGLLEAA